MQRNVNVFGLRQATAHTLRIPSGVGFVGLSDSSLESVRAYFGRRGVAHISQHLFLAVIVPAEHIGEFTQRFPFVTLPDGVPLPFAELAPAYEGVLCGGYHDLPRMFAVLLEKFSSNCFFICNPNKARFCRSLVDQRDLSGNAVALPFVCVRIWSPVALGKIELQRERVSTDTILQWLAGTMLKISPIVIFQAVRSGGVTLEQLDGLTHDQLGGLKKVLGWSDSAQAALDTAAHRGLRLKANDLLDLLEPKEMDPSLLLHGLLESPDKVKFWNTKVTAAIATAQVAEIKLQQGVFCRVCGYCLCCRGSL